MQIDENFRLPNKCLVKLVEITKRFYFFVKIVKSSWSFMIRQNKFSTYGIAWTKPIESALIGFSYWIEKKTENNKNSAVATFSCFVCF